MVVDLNPGDWKIIRDDINNLSKFAVAQYVKDEAGAIEYRSYGITLRIRKSDEQLAGLALVTPVRNFNRDTDGIDS